MSVQEFLQVNRLKTALMVDPGRNTGVAVFDRKPDHQGQHGFRCAETLYCPAKIKDENKVHWWLMYYFRELLDKYEPDKVFIESAELWSGSATSAASAGSGALFKLDRIAGGYAGVCCMGGYPCQFLLATAWKGQMTKDATRMRVLRALPDTIDIKSNHVIDAIGMGLALGGAL